MDLYGKLSHQKGSLDCLWDDLFDTVGGVALRTPSKSLLLINISKRSCNVQPRNQYDQMWHSEVIVMVL